MRLAVEQLNGEVLELDVTPETKIREVKRQIKAMHIWESKVSRRTTVVEIIVGDKKGTNDETMEELGVSSESKVAAVFRQNLAVCRDKSGLGPELDPDTLVVVEIPFGDTEIASEAFFWCERVAKVIIPSSVTEIGARAFAGCAALVAVNVPDSVTRIGDEAFNACGNWLTLNAPARLLCPAIGRVYRMVAKECGCRDCVGSWFARGWVCPMQHLSQLALSQASSELQESV